MEAWVAVFRHPRQWMKPSVLRRPGRHRSACLRHFENELGHARRPTCSRATRLGGSRRTSGVCLRCSAWRRCRTEGRFWTGEQLIRQTSAYPAQAAPPMSHPAAPYQLQHDVCWREGRSAIEPDGHARLEPGRIAQRVEAQTQCAAVVIADRPLCLPGCE